MTMIYIDMRANRRT